VLVCKVGKLFLLFYLRLICLVNYSAFFLKNLKRRHKITKKDLACPLLFSTIREYSANCEFSSSSEIGLRSLAIQQSKNIETNP
jgi:hypothetical protein